MSFLFAEEVNLKQVLYDTAESEYWSISSLIYFPLTSTNAFLSLRFACTW